MGERIKQQLQVAKAARELIADYSHWTTGAAARDKYGNICLSTSTSACQWCAVGAMNAAAGRRGLFGHIVYGLQCRMDMASPTGSIINLNDKSSYSMREKWEAVIVVYDKVIANLEVELL